MERRQIGLKLVMDCLGLPVKIDTFDDRLVLQKAIYLAQAAGLSLGYHYRWYLRGPYCPAVAEDGFAIAAALSQGLDEAKRWTLDSSSLAKLAKVRRLLRHQALPSHVTRLELLASSHFLVHSGQAAQCDAKGITDILRRFDKPFNQQQVKTAIREMVGHGLLR